MTTTNNTIDDLITAVQWLRSEKYPDVPGNLVTKILEIEADFLEDQVEASKRIAKLIESYLDGEKNDA